MNSEGTTLRQEKDSFPEWMLPSSGLVLIDDDENFLELMTRYSKSRNIKLSGYLSLEDMPSFAHLNNYDLVIVDYHLGCLVGTEIAEYVDIFFSNIPVILISSDDKNQFARKPRPRSIREFINKSEGPHEILRVALKILEEIRFGELLTQRTSHLYTTIF